MPKRLCCCYFKLMIKGIKKTFELVHILNSLSIIYISRKQLYKRVQKLRQILFKRSRLITIINWDSRTIKTWNSIWIIQMHSVSRLVKHLVVFFRPRREEDHSRLNRWPQRRCHFDDHSFPGFPIPPKRCCRLRPTDLHLRNNFDDFSECVRAAPRRWTYPGRKGREMSALDLNNFFLVDSGGIVLVRQMLIVVLLTLLDLYWLGTP